MLKKKQQKWAGGIEYPFVEWKVYIYTYTHTHTHTHIYI